MQEAPSELEIQIRDAPLGIFVGDKLVNDMLRPLQSPNAWLVLVPLTVVQVRLWEPHTPSSGS